MIKKTFKYLLLLLLALLLLVLMLFSYVIYTEHGSRLAIDFALQRTAIDVSYANIKGTLAKGLKLSKVQYQDESVKINIEDMAYQANWSIFNRFINVSLLQISDVDLWLRQKEPVTHNEQTFTGFKWPFALNVKQLVLNNLNIHNQENNQYIQHIQAQIYASGHQIEIKSLNLQTAELNWQSSGVIDSKGGLKYQFSPTFEVSNAEWQAKSKGKISGDLQSLQVNQDLMIKHPQIEGDWTVNGRIQSLSANPVLNLKFDATESQLILDDQLISFKQLQGTLAGHLDSLKLALESSLMTADLPPAHLVISGQGDLQQLQIERAQIKTENGEFGFRGHVDWQEQVRVNGQIQLVNFNPAQFIADWPGSLDGSISFDMQDTANGLFFISKNNQIQGELKGQPFVLKGDFDYRGEQISADQLSIELGQNSLLANGTINKNNVTFNVLLDWPDLEILGTDFSGQLSGKLSINGNPEHAEFKANVKAHNIRFQNFKSDQLTLNSHGVWQQDIQSEIKAANLLLNGHVIDDLTILQTGWLNQHQIKVSAHHDEWQHSISLDGSYRLNSHHWQGILQQHQLTLHSGKAYQLLEPVAIQWMNTVDIEPACWQGEAQGKLCVELNNSKHQFEAEISVDTLSLFPFQMWLPKGLQLTGFANGVAKINKENNNISIESNLTLKDGSLIMEQQDKPVYQVVINEFELLANANQIGSNVQLKFATDDGDELISQADISVDSNQQWQIDGKLNGVIKNTEAISRFSQEISEISGYLILNGEVNGWLKQPKLQLNFSQPTGHVKLSRLGTVIEQLKVQVATENNRYQFKISGQNLATINQGNFESTGVLTVSDGLKEQPDWSYQGHLSGQNFMIYNIPELKLHVSPELDINANQQQMKVQGDLSFDQGRVFIEQLPADTVVNSQDLLIHSKASDTTAIDYPISFDINTIITDRLELDVIGLKAFLLGSLRLQQAQNQGLSAIGTLNLEEGKYEVYGQKLDINAGEMIFNGSIDNPKLNVTASRNSLDGEVLAGVHLGGTVNNLQSELFSEPTLSDIETLAYIMTGNGINQGGSINGDQLKQTAILLGLNQGAPVFRQIQNTFGIDVLTIKEAADTEDTVIEAGKKINDKLYVSYNHGIFNRLGFWVLKYKLNEFLNLQTTQGEDQSIELVYTRKAKNSKEKIVDD